MLIVDSHEDLAWNMLTFGRDYTRAAQQTRLLERDTLAPQHNGDTLLGWEEYQRGGVSVIFATLFASPASRRRGEWDVLYYEDTSQAREVYRRQLDAYHRLAEEHARKFKLIQTRDDLVSIQHAWRSWLPIKTNEEDSTKSEGYPLGLVILMEGAEAIGSPAELEDWWQGGLRLIGPAWTGTRFCGGTREPGPLTDDGFALLEAMAEIGFGLDLSHMDEQAALQALDMYPGVILASHSNAQELLKGTSSNRHLSARLIQGIIERQGVIGVVFYNGFLKAGWRRGDPKEAVSLHHVVAQIDYICQIAGDSSHVGIGSDFDGGFGVQSTPMEVDTVADLRKLVPLLESKGYQETDIAQILGKNWMHLLERIFPA